jgi:hypothetical protein
MDCLPSCILTIGLEKEREMAVLSQFNSYIQRTVLHPLCRDIIPPINVECKLPDLPSLNGEPIYLLAPHPLLLPSPLGLPFAASVLPAHRCLPSRCPLPAHQTPLASKLPPYSCTPQVLLLPHTMQPGGEALRQQLKCSLHR